MRALKPENFFSPTDSFKKKVKICLRKKAVVSANTIVYKEKHRFIFLDKLNQRSFFSAGKESRYGNLKIPYPRYD